MLNFFIGFAFFEFGALCGFFVAALMQAARDGDEIAGRSRTENIQYCSVYYKADSPNDSECTSLIWVFLIANVPTSLTQ